MAGTGLDRSAEIVESGGSSSGDTHTAKCIKRVMEDKKLNAAMAALALSLEKGKLPTRFLGTLK